MRIFTKTGNMIDLRSDTITKPTPAMLETMMSAPVGDDVFGEDPTVNRLQEKVANLFGKEAALFCPSGTMTNQIAIRVQTQPQQEIICDKNSHIYQYEGGGMAYNSFVSVCLVHGDRGRITARQIEENIRPDDIYAPVSSLVCLENTHNKGGGSYYTLDQIMPIHKICRKYNLSIHLDGARIFNALAETGESTYETGKYFDTVSVCLSKGLGAPAGSLIAGSKELINKALRVRKVLGGAMRQSGYLAAAGLYALDHHVGRLKDDHKRAAYLGKILEGLPFVDYVMPVDTNIVIFRLTGELTATEFLTALQERGILGVPFGKRDIRFVTHLDFNDDQLDLTESILKNLKV